MGRAGLIPNTNIVGAGFSESSARSNSAEIITVIKSW